MHNYTTKIIACAVVIEELRSKLNSNVECEILDFGLHRSPEQLKIKLHDLEISKKTPLKFLQNND